MDHKKSIVLGIWMKFKARIATTGKKDIHNFYEARRLLGHFLFMGWVHRKFNLVVDNNGWFLSTVKCLSLAHAGTERK